MRLPASLVLIALTLAAHGAVIGTNPPSLPLTAERITALPATQQSPWRDYLARSEHALAADTKFYADEMKAAGLPESLVPTRGGSLRLKEPAAWYAGAEVKRIADIVVSYQTPAGGWNKNTSMTDHLRRPGERSGYEHGYVGTFDNDATTTHLAFLARVITAIGPEAPATAPYRAAFFRGIDYIFAAQFPSGGWPQVWPLEGGYHDMITFNDGAMINLLTLLRDIATPAPDFVFVPKDLRARTATSIARGLSCILATQIVTADGRRTVWCQQHDPLTLTPSSARNYEMPSQSSGESAGIMMFLMTLAEPSPAVVTAVRSAATWFEKTIVHDATFKPGTDGTGRHLNHVEGATPLWPRYSEIGSDRPLFGDRDKTIHDNVDEISKERRNGYAWFGDAPKRALAHYEKWSTAH